MEERKLSNLSNIRRNATKEGRSAILIIRSLDKMDLQESTVKRVLTIILEAKGKYGEEIAEQMATELMELVEESETEEELLSRLNQLKEGGRK